MSSAWQSHPGSSSDCAACACPRAIGSRIAGGHALPAVSSAGCPSTGCATAGCGDGAGTDEPPIGFVDYLEVTFGCPGPWSLARRGLGRHRWRRRGGGGAGTLRARADRRWPRSEDRQLGGSDREDRQRERGASDLRSTAWAGRWSTARPRARSRGASPWRGPTCSSSAPAPSARRRRARRPRRLDGARRRAAAAHRRQLPRPAAPERRPRARLRPALLPHDRRTLVRYLSRFTEWIPARYVVKSRVGGRLYPFPINLDTLEQFFGRTFTPEQARGVPRASASRSRRRRTPEQFVLAGSAGGCTRRFTAATPSSSGAREPRELDPAVCGRIPVRLDRDDRYVEQRASRRCPTSGYTALFGRMLDHPDLRAHRRRLLRRARADPAPRIATVYTGAIDRYFDYRFGAARVALAAVRVP